MVLTVLRALGGAAFALFVGALAGTLFLRAMVLVMPVWVVMDIAGSLVVLGLSVAIVVTLGTGGLLREYAFGGREARAT